MIVNFTLDKISVDKKAPAKGTIEAKNSIKFLKVSEQQLPEGLKDQFLLDFKFQYKVDYLPDIASTEIVGHLHFMTTKEGRDKILKDWDKDSRIEPSLSGKLVNYVFAKCGVMALSLSRQVGLPPHIPLPKIAIRTKQDDSKGNKEKPRAS